MLRPTLVTIILVLIGFQFTGCAITPKRVVVMDFENLTNDHSLDHLSGAMPECLTTVMNRNSDRVIVMERQDINYYLREIDRTVTPLMRMSRWQELGRRLDIDYLVSGSVSKFGDDLVIQTRLFSVKYGDVVPNSGQGLRCESVEQIPEMAMDLGAKLTDRIVMASE